MMAAELILAFRYKVMPTRNQHKILKEALEQSRQIFNAALAERIDCYKKTGKGLTFFDQAKSLTELRIDEDFSRFPAIMQRYALQRLNHAYNSFFKRGGFPRFKGKCRYKSLGWNQSNGWSLKDGRFIAKGIGSLKINWTRELPSKPKAVRLVREGKHWFISFLCSVEKSLSNNLPSVGLDMGVAHLASLSSGEHIENVRVAKRFHAKTRRQQRALSRCKRGSNRRRKVRERLARLKLKEARGRKTYIHQVTADITSRYGKIVLEDLKIINMTKAGKYKTGLNRSMQDASLGIFKQLLTYKAERAGGELVLVDPKYTSQTCSVCGSIDKNSRKTQSQFTCTGCGHKANADLNAARNIAMRGGVVIPDDHNVGGFAERDHRKVMEAAK